MLLRTALLLRGLGSDVESGPPKKFAAARRAGAFACLRYNSWSFHYVGRVLAASASIS